MLKKILKFKLKFLGVAVVLLLLLHLITAYMFGFTAQKQLEQQFQKITDTPLIKVVKHDYKRGIFSSTETTELAINNQTIATVLNLLPRNESVPVIDQTYSIKYTTKINHGIFIGLLHGSLIPTIAYSTTTIEYSDKIKDILNKFFNNQPPLTITNIIYLNKSGKISISSPTFAYAEAVSGVKVNWGGLDLVVNYNAGFNKFYNNLTIPLLELIAPSKGSVVLRGIYYNSATNYSVNNIKVGDTNLRVDGVEVTWKDSVALNFKLGDVVRILTGINSVDFLNNIDTINPSDFYLHDVTYISNSSDDGQWFNANAKAGFVKLVTNKKEYGPMNLDIGLQHFLSTDFSKMLDTIEAASIKEPTNANNQQLITDLKAVMAPILVAEPVITLNKFEINTPDGLLSLSGKATTNGFKLADMDEQESFMSKLNVDFSFSVPKPILSYLFVLQMKYLLSAGNAKMDAKSSEALTKVVNILLNNQINSWVKKGLLKQNANIIEGYLAYVNGNVELKSSESAILK